jgi:hypothetical protein
MKKKDPRMAQFGPLDIARLHSILYQELNSFDAQRQDFPVAESQDLNGYFVEYFAVFLPELFSSNIKHSLRDKVMKYYNCKNYNIDIWYRSTPLEAAVFAIDGDLQCARSCVANIDHANGLLRTAVLNAVALIAPRLDFCFPEVADRLKNNIVIGQSQEKSLAILLALNGPLSRKMQLIHEILNESPRKEMPNRLEVEDFYRRPIIKNPFVEFSSWLIRYVTLQLLQAPLVEDSMVSIIRTLFDDVLLQDVNKCMSLHPVFQPLLNSP